MDNIDDNIKDMVDVDEETSDVKMNYKAIASVIDYINEDRSMAQESFNYFRNRIEMENDGRAATREAVTKSLEIKNRATDQLLRLLEIQVKMIVDSKKKDGININIYDGQVIIDKRALIEKIDRGEI